MRVGLIDLGSNTIKYAVYEVCGQTFSQVAYDVNYAYIVGCVENNRLSDEGIGRIVDTLQRFERAAKALGCEKLFCFSTASLRYIDNQKDVIDEVFRQTKIEILPLSGEEEARCNALSMGLVARSPIFYGADLGGGSLQLFRCENRRVTAEGSLPLGALKLYHAHVSGVLPTREEANDICKTVRQTLGTESPVTGTAECLYFMGGSVRMMARMLTGTEEPFSVDALDRMIETFLDDPAAALDQIRKTVPERERTILPGMLVVREVCRMLETKTVIPTTNSVREGFLMQWMQGEEEG